MKAPNHDHRSGAPAGAGAPGRTSTTIPVLPIEVAEAVSDARNHLAQYILVRELGQGGSGTVYAAWDRKLGRWAAVKILNQINEENAARFLREAQMASRLSHPSIVPLFEASEAEDGRPFLAMKLVSGRQLSKVQLDIKTACSVMRDVADAVQYAHDNGVIHRDLKPQNLMLDDAGHVWILDFGIAHWVGTGSTLTAAGAVLGTPAFMPPEQARGAHCDERSDVYALGATLYALLSGRPPFEGDNALWVMTQVLADEPPALRLLNNRVARDVENIVHKAMRREPAQRYSRARAFADDLRRYERGDVVTARPLPLLARAAKKVKRYPVAAVIVAAAVLGVGLFGWGSLRYASDMRVREEATAEARALAEARLAEAKKNLRVAEINRAEGIVEEGNALGASGQWQAAAARYQAADTMFKGLQIDDPGPNAGMTDVLMNAPPPVWSEPAFHAGRITELLVNRDETAGYSSSLDGTVKIFDPRSRQVKQVFDLGAQVWSLALNADGTRLAAGVHDGRVVVWDLRNYNEVATFRQSTSRVRGVAFSRDGRLLTGAHFDGEISTWDLGSGKRLHGWKENCQQVHSVAYTPYGDTVVTGLSHARMAPWATLHAGRSGKAIDAYKTAWIPSGIRNLVVDEITGRIFAGFGGGFVSAGPPGQAPKIFFQPGATPNVAVSSSDGVIVLAFANAGMQVRDYNDPSRVLFSVKEEAGQLAVPGRAGRVWSGDTSGGLKLWSVGAQPAMGRIANRPLAIGLQVIMVGQVIVLEEAGGAFTAFDRGTGKTLWTVKLPVPKAADDFELASKRADGTAANHLSLARYYTLRGLHDWAAEQFDRFYEMEGALRAEVGALEYGRALWLGGRLDAALVQYRRALANGEAAPDYLNLCIAAIERARK